MLYMKTIDEIRYENLDLLISNNGGLTALVEKSGGKLNRATLDQIWRKRTTAAGTIKNVGDDLARNIEISLRLEKGWMDNQKGVVVGETDPTAIPSGQLMELVNLFSASTPKGRELIIQSARNAPKLVITGQTGVALDKS